MAEDSKGKPGVGFTREGAARVASVVRFVERKYRLAPPPRGRYPVGGGGSGVQFATLNALLPAMTGSTPGSAHATLKNFDGTSFSAGDTATVYNAYTGSIASGKLVVLAWAYNGWFVITANC